MSAVAVTAQPAPASGDTQDSELVRQLRRGDDRAFEQLYLRYHRRITAYIQGMVGDHARAEDITQDVFVSALRRMRDTDRPIAFKPWIYEIAKNACIDQFRRSRRAEEVSFDAEEGFGGADYGRLVSADPTPERRLESKQSLDHLRGAFGGLSEAHHQILVMRELEGLSYREIGERLGMSRPSVESTLFRARRRLTEEYEELVSGARCQRIQSIIAGAGAGGLGARDQRTLARHVSHCQPCRRHACRAGVEMPVLAGRPVRERIALLLPLPLFLRRRWLGEGTGEPATAGLQHSSAFVQWSAQLGSAVDPSWLKAAATAATVVVAGVGAGAAANGTTPRSPAGDLAQIVARLGGPIGPRPAAPVTARAAGPSAAAATRRAGAPALHRPGAPARSGASTRAQARGASTAASSTVRSGNVADSLPSGSVPGLSSSPHRPGGRHGGAGQSSPLGPELPARIVPTVPVAAPAGAAVGHAVSGAGSAVTTAAGALVPGGR